jgi:ABC-2 type transport system ATP-binding protein
MIKVDKLHKTYSSTVALNNISFELKPGVVTGFLGPNGSGKTTTMRMMLGLSKGSGKTLFGNQTYSQIKNPGQHVGVMLESKAFDPNMSAKNHLLMYAYGIGLRGKKAKDRVKEVIDFVGLESTGRKKNKKFSLGMSQRLSVATAILGDPEYVILDEPANGLDPDGIIWMRNLLGELASQGKTVFLSSHLINEISQIATDLIIIGKGNILANDTLENVLGQYSKNQIILEIEPTQVDQTLELIKTIPDSSINAQENNILKISGSTKIELGKLLHKNNICVFGLEEQKDSLEQIFMQLTNDTIEYKAKRN